jgi:hypothetical protein
MKFTDTLKSLEAKACASDGTADFVVDYFLYSNYLTSHAQEIINLVEAAEEVCNPQSFRDHLSSHVDLREALAALNKEQL